MTRVIIATGGTGGHIYPALSLAETLKEDQVDYLFAGADLSKNPYFDKQEPFKDIHSGSGIKQVFSLIKGIYQSYKLFKKKRPEVVVGFGSYHSFPILAAATLSRIPIVLFAADSIPGKVIRWFSPYAKTTGVHFPEALKKLKGKGQVVKMPLRASLTKNKNLRVEALNYFGLSGLKPILLVVGGSKGAAFLNKIVPAVFEDRSLNWDIIHISGSAESCLEVTSLYEKLGKLAVVKPFEFKMNYAWEVAAIACTRAGAGSIAEALEFEVPCVLIPYPFAMDDHQDKNADYFVSLRPGYKLIEKEISPIILRKKLISLLNESKVVNKYIYNKSPHITLKDLVKDHLKEVTP